MQCILNSSKRKTNHIKYIFMGDLVCVLRIVSVMKLFISLNQELLLLSRAPGIAEDGF